MIYPRLLISLAFAALTLCLPAYAAAPGKPVEAREFMISAANPHAVRAGHEILAAGGSAVDSAIATQLVLSLVEPQSSGIGGGAFMLHYDPARAAGATEPDGAVTFYDGRETAPEAAGPDLFLDANGAPLDFRDAAFGGRAVGVPGVMRMLARAHAEHGVLPWARLFEPAIRLAEEGFEISPRLHFLLARYGAFLKRFPAAREYFFTADGAPLPVGFRRDNQAYAAVLRQLAADGVEAFYTGTLARDIVAATRHSPTNPGLLSLDDLKAYEVKKRASLCAPYRTWRVCGMPPPSSGGIAVLQILGLLQSFDLGALAPNSGAALHLIAEASRLAFADREIYLGDPDFVPVPTQGLIDHTYLAERAMLIDPDRTMGIASAGTPPMKKAQLDWGPDRAPDVAGTSHFSIIDRAGRAVAMTTTVQTAFGSGLLVHGFLLNNQLTDFSFEPVVNGKPVANRPQSGKRPRSSMAPTLVFDGANRPRAIIGSPGGSRIIGYVAQTLIGILDWGLDIQRAIDLPHLINRNGPTELEQGHDLGRAAATLRKKGHDVRTRSMNSGLHGITIHYDDDGQRLLQGGADPRREGIALGR